MVALITNLCSVIDYTMKQTGVPLLLAFPFKIHKYIKTIKITYSSKKNCNKRRTIVVQFTDNDHATQSGKCYVIY